MEDLITKIEQMQAEAREGMKRASRDSDPYLYQYLVGKFHAFGKVAGILKKQKECVADSSKTSTEEDERTRKEIIHYLFYTAGGLSIEEQNRWIAYLEKQKEQKPAEWSEEQPDVFDTAAFQKGVQEGRRLEREDALTD